MEFLKIVYWHNKLLKGTRFVRKGEDYNLPKGSVVESITEENPPNHLVAPMKRQFSTEHYSNPDTFFQQWNQSKKVSLPDLVLNLEDLDYSALRKS